MSLLQWGVGRGTPYITRGFLLIEMFPKQAHGRQRTAVVKARWDTESGTVSRQTCEGKGKRHKRLGPKPKEMAVASLTQRGSQNENKSTENVLYAKTLFSVLTREVQLTEFEHIHILHLTPFGYQGYQVTKP